jgi:hypothetical protein
MGLRWWLWWWYDAVLDLWKMCQGAKKMRLLPSSSSTSSLLHGQHHVLASDEYDYLQNSRPCRKTVALNPPHVGAQPSRRAGGISRSLLLPVQWKLNVLPTDIRIAISFTACICGLVWVAFVDYAS